MTATEQSSPAFSDARRQHLEFIQAVVGRMSAATGICKGWAVTIAVAAYGYAASQNSVVVNLLGIGAVVVLAVVDGEYLLQERRYRALFDLARTNSVDPYDMDARSACDRLPATDQRRLLLRSTLKSWSIWKFYGPLIAGGALILGWLLASRLPLGC